MTTFEILDHLKQNSSEKYLTGMLRFGVDNSRAYGVPVPELRKLAKAIKKNHPLALELWDTGIHEARILATMIDDAALVTPEQLDAWVADFYAWDICDQACGNLFDRTPFAIEKAIAYCANEQEYIKRAGFVLMAEFAVHNKKAPDEMFISLLPIMEREAWDGRNFVIKAVNWALRQIGKRNPQLRVLAIATAQRILLQENKSAKWIATNALQELG
jgi:3-methyladenine DNA glycosylase AlkD